MIYQSVKQIIAGLWSGKALIGHKLILVFISPVLALSMAGCNGKVFQSLFDKNYNALLFGSSPYISSITSANADGRYGASVITDPNSYITFTITFSEPVDLTGGTLNVTLSSGAVVPITPFTNASSASAMYAVSPGENSSSLRVSGIALGVGATFTRTGETVTAVVLSLPGSNFSSNNIIIDTTPPTISSITSTTADGLYGIDDAINLTVNFSETVTLSGGNLQVTLETGTVDRVITITPFSNSLTASGIYTVGIDDESSDLDNNTPFSCRQAASWIPAPLEPPMLWRILTPRPPRPWPTTRPW